MDSKMIEAVFSLKKNTFITVLVLLLFNRIVAQENSINWLNFEQLEDSFTVNPKNVFIVFYADWCAYCKKMDKAAFADAQVIHLLNTDYYAVRMNAETRDSVVFGGDTYINKEMGKKRKPTHEIPLLLASRKDHPFSLPALVILNKKFEVTARYFEYLSPKRLKRVLSE